LTLCKERAKSGNDRNVISTFFWKGISVAYKVIVKISIMRENDVMNSEETTFDNLNFEKMTRAAAEYYDMTTKIEKAVK